jgi:uncharacterized protein YndB with AHSA1/START domain
LIWPQREPGSSPRTPSASCARWFRVPSRPEEAHYELDFRVGGHENARGAFAPYGDSGDVERIEYRSTFLDIVPGERVVRSYELLLKDVRRWVSLVTVELAPHDGGTRLTHTEQYVFLTYTDAGEHDVAHLKGSTRLQLNGLLAALCPLG